MSIVERFHCIMYGHSDVIFTLYFMLWTDTYRNQYVYYSDLGQGLIGRVGFNGSAPETLIVTGVGLEFIGKQASYHERSQMPLLNINWRLASSDKMQHKQCYTVDREFFVDDLFRWKLNTRTILHNVHRPIPILVAEVWWRNLYYVKNLQAKYFTGENIVIYGTLRWQLFEGHCILT